MTGTEPRRQTPPNCRALSACRSPLTPWSARLPTGRTPTRTAACRPTSGSSSSATRCSSLVVTDTLFKGHPDLPEGQLAKLRAAVVQMNALAEVARELRLGSFVRLGRGEEGTGGRDKPSILADTLEAVIGATYIDCGLDEASALVHRLFDPVIERSSLLGAGLDWKTSLQELTADRGLGVPEYLVKDSGPDHQKLFLAVVKVGSRELGAGEGRSKKAAEQLAAEAAYRAITAEHADREELDAACATRSRPSPPAAGPGRPEPPAGRH